MSSLALQPALEYMREVFRQAKGGAENHCSGKFSAWRWVIMRDIPRLEGQYACGYAEPLTYGLLGLGLEVETVSTLRGTS